MTKTLKLDINDINSVDLSPLSTYLQWHPETQSHFMQNAGREHYKLLAYISQQFQQSDNIEIIDVGTVHGANALALSYNESVRVFSIDNFRKQIPEQDNVLTPLKRSNIRMWVVSPQAIMSKLLEAKIIIVDLEPHDAIHESDIINKLVIGGYKGIVILDDIYLNDNMKALWSSIPKHLKKIDATKYGHWTGTGIVVFDGTVIDITTD